VPNDNVNDEQDPSKLRQLIDSAHSKLGEKDTRIKELEGRLAVSESGLGHLNDVQRGAIIHVIGDGEVTADSMKAAATSLGFSLAPPQQNNQPTNQPSQQGQQNQNQNNGDGNANSDDANQPQFLKPMFDSEHPDPREARNVAIQGLTEFEYAAVMAQRGGTGTRDFKEAIDKATSKEEVLAVIRQQGRNEGLILEGDTI
jgi:hypothetical protein